MDMTFANGKRKRESLMTRLWTAGIACLCAALLAGCGTTGKFVYPAEMSSLVRFDSSPAAGKRVAVLPFDDCRGDENSCLFAMYLIPLMPFGWADYERPDAANMFLSVVSYDTDPAEDLAKATAVSFRRSQLFRDVFFTMGGEKDRADFVVRGRLKKMRYRGKQFSYGLSLYGPLLWLFGAPAGMSENEIDLELEMTDKAGRKVWNWTVTDRDRIVQWIYGRMGHDVKMFTRMYQDGMNRALEDLARRMKADPGRFR